MDSLKRPRRTSQASSSSSDSDSSTSSLVPKLWRPSSPNSNDTAYTCSLPPTCASAPVSFATSSLYAQHYQTFHSYVCQAPPSTYAFAQSSTDKHKHIDEDGAACGRIFPDQNLLDLHLQECHDPVTQVLQQRGDKTFECLDRNRGCLKKFSTPKNRRLHLIAEHGYPKEWFFGVTVWGIGDVLDRGRHGMVRKDWTPRPGQPLHRPSRQHGDANEREGHEDDDAGKFDEEHKKEDDGMDELVKGLQGTSIAFVPRSVAGKRKQSHTTTANAMSIENPKT
ncbi:hypothetical protein JCM11491_004371 [Sporobolomyces phaffii]